LGLSFGKTLSLAAFCPQKSKFKIIAKKKQKTPDVRTKPRQSQTKPVSKALSAFPKVAGFQRAAPFGRQFSFAELNPQGAKSLLARAFFFSCFFLR
jgi:hypothetical protein